MASNGNIIGVDRDYIDTFSIKDFAVNELVPKYFPDQTPSMLTTGQFGMLTEYVSTITEDSFNTGSSLVAESFPTRAKMESSIYANAAVFQYSNAFGQAGTCNILIGIPEKDLLKNLISKPGTNYKYFYIDKATIITVGGIPFTLDYDIEIRAVYREIRKGYVYSAKYLLDESDYINSVSDIHDPYIRMQKHSNGLLTLMITVKQYIRNIIYESITNNATLNYSSVEFTYSGVLLGFDVLYKAPGDSDFNTQLDTKVVYSLPSKKPFCYFRPLGSNKIELSFTTNGSYFQPDFNSELKIIIYTTKGSKGNFPEYTGQEIVYTKGEAYDYNDSWMVGAKINSGCSGGNDPMSIEGLQSLTVEGYSTALSITTEHDLHVYFSNYKYRYGSEILAIKKRNDAVELLFSTFMFLKKDDYMYPTNTLSLDTNILALDYKDGGSYVLDPGYLFGYRAEDIYALPIYYIVVDGDGEKYDVNGLFYNMNGEHEPSGDITLKELQQKIDGRYVEESEHKYYKLKGDNTSNFYLYHADGTLDEDHDPITTIELFEKFASGDVLYKQKELDTKEIDFIIDLEKEIEARKSYIQYFDTYKLVESLPDINLEEYMNAYSFKDYKNEHNIDNRRSIFNTDVENFPEKQPFMFTNPFMISVLKSTGLVTYYQTFISQDSIMDFIKENDEDSFMQFISYTFSLRRDISDVKKYKIKLVFIPSVPLDNETQKFIDIIYNEEDESLFELYDGAKPSLSNFKKDVLSNNRFRCVLTFLDEEKQDIGYMELIPTHSTDNDQITMEGEFYTDDYITTGNNFRVVHVCPYCGETVLNSANKHIENYDYYCPNCDHTFKEGIINIRESDSLMLPIMNANIRITTLFKDPETDEKGGLTNNAFVQHDPTYKNYIWTNIYNTTNDPITFIKPLTMMRSVISYKDYFIAGVDPLDCKISDIPLLKYSIIRYKDEGMDITDPFLSDDIGKFDYFMRSFLGTYDILRDAKTRMNGLNMDIKFYNTYGKSTNFTIGEGEEIIDTNNISISFDVYILDGTDPIKADDELKLYIKDYIEKVNEKGTNNLYISNLIKSVENDFPYVHHLTYKGINSYPIKYQAIINRAIDLEDLSKEERRTFVPDLLVVNLGNIILRYYHP